jgi:hypothetical protein
MMAIVVLWANTQNYESKGASLMDLDSLKYSVRSLMDLDFIGPSVIIWHL